MIGLLRSNLGIFLLRKFGIVWVYIDLPGVVIWQHIHPSTLYSYWEEGWQDSSCLRASKAWESFVSLDWIPIDSPCLSTIPLLIIIHLDQSLLKFLSCSVESTRPFAVRVVDSRPSVLLHPSGAVITA